MVKIIKTGVTYTDKDGEVRLILTGDLPEDCAVIFVSKEDYDEAERLLKEG